jgi:oligoendopeptidase F
MSRRAAVVIAVLALILPAAAQQRDRASIPEKYKWDLTHIYPSNDAWRAAKDKLQGEISSVRSFKGTLGRSPAALADALETCVSPAKDALTAFQRTRTCWLMRTRVRPSTRVCARR